MKELKNAKNSAFVRREAKQRMENETILNDKEAVARLILGDDIIFPSEISKVRKVQYTDAQLKYFFETIPDQEVLHWCKANQYAIIAGPPFPMGVLKIRSLKPELFFSKKNGWYEKEQYIFSRKDKVGTKWIIIKKVPVPNSTNKNWHEQLFLLLKKERVPNAAEMCWFITTFYEVNRIKLFDKEIYVRTSSVTFEGMRVLVGPFSSDGLIISGYWDESKFPVFGLAASLNLKFKTGLEQLEQNNWNKRT